MKTKQGTDHYEQSIARIKLSKNWEKVNIEGRTYLLNRIPNYEWSRNRLFSATSTRTAEQLYKWQSIWWINVKDRKFLILWDLVLVFGDHILRGRSHFTLGFFFQLLPSHIINKNNNPKSNKILNKYILKIKSKKLNKLKYLSPLCHKFASSLSHFLHPLDLAMWRISLQSEKLEVSSYFFTFLFLKEMEQKKNQTEEQLSTEIKMKLFCFFLFNKIYKMKRFFSFCGNYIRWKVVSTMNLTF